MSPMREGALLSLLLSLAPMTSGPLPVAPER
jgi:hypothetical protein